MKRLFIVLAALLISAGTLDAQSLQWAESMGGLQNEIGWSSIVDATGNVYITGEFIATADFDPGPGTYYLVSSGNRDIFILKLDHFGNFLWAKSMGSDSEDVGLSIAVDQLGNVYTTGYFSKTAEFGLYSLISTGGLDMFVEKLDASGNVIWAKSIGGDAEDRSTSIAADAFGNVYTTGFYNGTVDFDPGPGTFNLTAAVNEDIFIQKLDTSGHLVWAKSLDGNLLNEGKSIAVDVLGNVYTTGLYSGTVDFDPGPGTFSMTGGLDIFIQKMDSSGNFLWAKSIGDIAVDNSYSIAVDAFENVYTTGHFGGTVDFDPGPGVFSLTAPEGFSELGAFVLKLDASGSFVWAKSMGDSFSVAGWSIALDASANVYTTGQFLGTADFDPGPGTFSLTTAGSWDIFVQKLDSSGNFLWALSMGGTTGSDVGTSITLDASGYVYTIGGFRGTADFDPGAGTVSLTSAGNNDVFVQKLSQATGILEPVKDVHVTAYPNPTNGLVNISFDRTLNDAELTLTNVLGRVVTQRSFASLMHTTLEMPQTPGLYFLSIKAKEGSSTVRLIRE